MKEVEFLQYILEWLVENKEDIDIIRTEDELWVLLTVKVNKDDMWLVIWKWWNTVNSLRSLLKVLGLKIWKRVNLKILD
jgi:predicted RNA-binding protein YlqC (UPF0109 family)